MAVLAHAEENKVQNGLPFVVARDKTVKLSLRCLGSVLRWQVPPNAMDTTFRNLQRAQEEFVGQAEVTLGMVRRNTALVAPEEMDPLQRCRSCDDLTSQSRVKGAGNP